MTLKDILEKCSGLRVVTERDYSDECVELIIRNEEIAQWNRILEDVLGPPVKPAGVTPRREDRSLAADHGGIARNQVLFYQEFEDMSVIAMFWPWKDGENVTLKMACLEDEDKEEDEG